MACARAVAAGGGLRLRGREQPGRLARARRRGGRPARQAAVRRRDRRVAAVAARRGRPDVGPARRRRPGRRAGPADGTLADERLAGLLGLARRLASPARVEQPSACWPAGRPRTSCGASRPRRSGSEPGRADRARPAVELLEQAPPADVLAMLSWAAASEVGCPRRNSSGTGGRASTRPARAELARCSALPGDPARSARTAGGRAAGGGRGRCSAARSAPGSRRDDLAGHPELTELWLLQCGGPARNRSRCGPSTRSWTSATAAPALAAGRRGAAAPAVAGRLPAGSARGAARLADRSRPRRTSLRLVRGADQRRSAARATSDRAGSGWPRRWPSIRSWRCCPRRRPGRYGPRCGYCRCCDQARAGGPQVTWTAFAALFRRVPTADDDTRRLLDRELPRGCARADPLGRALRGCPTAVAAAFCRSLATGWRPRRPTPPSPGGSSSRSLDPDAGGPARAQRAADGRLRAGPHVAPPRPERPGPGAGRTTPDWRRRSRPGGTRTRRAGPQAARRAGPTAREA